MWPLSRRAWLAVGISLALLCSIRVLLPSVVECRVVVSVRSRFPINRMTRSRRSSRYKSMNTANTATIAAAPSTSATGLTIPASRSSKGERATTSTFAATRS